MIRGKTVDRASGRRRVKNSVEACRYVLDTWVDDGRADEIDDSEEMDAESRCEDTDGIASEDTTVGR